MKGYDDRIYQQEALGALRANIKAGIRRQILCAPTGSGKTVIALYLIEAAMRKHSRVAFIADREALVFQTSRRLWEAGLDHGITMSDSTRDRHERVQVCSAQTLEKRGFWPDTDLLIVDEAHSLRKSVAGFAEGSNVVTVGLTATPFTKGLGKIYQAVVNARTTYRLIEENWIVPLKVYCAHQIDMTGAPTSNGEWSDAEVEKRALPITGDIVTEWVKYTGDHFGGPVKTLVFSATTAHGEELVRQFADAGFYFDQVSYRDKDSDVRQAKIRALEYGDIDGLVSVEALAKGFDLPDIKCLVVARPYRNSLSGHIQMLGRGMRAAQGKEYCLVLDHANNFLRFAYETESFWEHGWPELDEGKRKDNSASPREIDPTRECPKCNYVMPSHAKICPACGAARAPRPIGIKVRPGSLEEYQSLREIAGGDLWPQISRIALDRYPGDPGLALRFAKAQYKEITGGWPATRELAPCLECDIRILKVVERNVARYRRRMKKQKAA